MKGKIWDTDKGATAESCPAESQPHLSHHLAEEILLQTMQNWGCGSPEPAGLPHQPGPRPAACWLDLGVPGAALNEMERLKGSS